MNRARLQAAAACALVFVLGVAAGALRPSSARKIAAGTTASTTNARLTSAYEPLARALERETGAKRWLLTVSIAEHATVRDMPSIIRALGNDEAAVRLLGTRWAELDPKDMLGYLLAEYLQPEDAPNVLPQRSSLTEALTEALAEQWAKGDPAGLRKALTEVPSSSARDSLRGYAASFLMNYDVETGLLALSDWKTHSYISEKSKVAEWAARDPRHATEFVAKHGYGSAGQRALEFVGKAWATSDPEAGLQIAASLDPKSRATLGAAILSNWADRDAAARFISSQTDLAFRNSIAKGFVDEWSKKDPAAALEWSGENLRGNAYTKAIYSIVKTAARKDVVAAGELVVSMEPGAAQNTAASTLFETWFTKGKDERAASLDWLAALPDKETRTAALDRVQWDWANRDPAGLREFITGPHGELASPSLINAAVLALAKQRPEAALEWTTKLPADRIAKARNSVLDSWLDIRPADASEYARNLPAGPERERALMTVTERLIWRSPESAAAWLKKLPEADQAKVVKDSELKLEPEDRAKLNAAMKAPAGK